MLQAKANTMSNPESVPPKTTRRSGKCPSCGARAGFTFIGVQKWPLEVAQRFGLNPCIRMWKCNKCLTSISEPDLE